MQNLDQNKSVEPFQYLEQKGVDTVGVRKEDTDFRGSLEEVKRKLNDEDHDWYEVDQSRIEEIEDGDIEYIEIEVPYSILERDLIGKSYSGSGRTETMTIYGTTEMEETQDIPVPADD